MTAYILRRLLGTIPIILIVGVITFFWSSCRPVIRQCSMFRQMPPRTR